jgi:hypothetical protein
MKGEKMANRLDILGEQLEVGDVKTITYNSGNNIKMIELLFSPTTKAQFAPTDDKKSLQISISDNILQIPELYCTIDKEKLYNLVVSLKKMYAEILENGE